MRRWRRSSCVSVPQSPVYTSAIGIVTLIQTSPPHSLAPPNPLPLHAPQQPPLPLHGQIDPRPHRLHRHAHLGLPLHRRHRRPPPLLLRHRHHLRLHLLLRLALQPHRRDRQLRHPLGQHARLLALQQSQRQVAVALHALTPHPLHLHLLHRHRLHLRGAGPLRRRAGLEPR